MRERAELYGGTLDAGPHPDGGFAVTAVLPYGLAAGSPGDDAAGHHTDADAGQAGGEAGQAGDRAGHQAVDKAGHRIGDGVAQQAGDEAAPTGGPR